MITSIPSQENRYLDSPHMIRNSWPIGQMSFKYDLAIGKQIIIPETNKKRDSVQDKNSGTAKKGIEK